MSGHAQQTGSVLAEAAAGADDGVGRRHPNAIAMALLTATAFVCLALLVAAREFRNHSQPSC